MGVLVRSKNPKNSSYKKTSTSKSLVIVDNAPLRKKAIQYAHKNLQKIEDLEKSSSQFNDVDLKLYEDWYKLTLSSTLETIQKTQQEFNSLADFHNMMIIVSKTQNISIPEAYLFLKHEEDQYKSGNAEICNQIKLAREQRKQDLEAEINKTRPNDQCDCAGCRRERAKSDGPDNAYCDSDNFDESQDDDAEFSEMKKDEETILRNREKHKNLIQNLEAMSDKKITQSMRNFDAGVQFLLDAFSLLLPCSRTDILRRIWKLAPSNQKIVINKIIKKQFEMTADEMMDQDEELQQIRDDHFNENYFTKNNQLHQNAEVSESIRIQVKSIYKKIVRKIHPDCLKLDQHPHLKSWFEVIWKKVADAHKNNDLKNITNLQHKVLIVLKEYDELGLYDLKSAAESFSEEHLILSTEFSNLKNHPAWNFSNLKNYKILETKVKKPLSQQLNKIKKQIKKLTADHEEIKMVAQLFKENKIRLSNRKAGLKKKKKSLSKPSAAQMGFTF